MTPGPCTVLSTLVSVWAPFAVDRAGVPAPVVLNVTVPPPARLIVAALTRNVLLAAALTKICPAFEMFP